MLTDRPPRKASAKAEYDRSEAMHSLHLPPQQQLQALAKEIEKALAAEDRARLEVASNAFAVFVAESFGVAPPKVRVLGVRPLQEKGDFVDETFGDYQFATARIRLWMRTAVLEKVTSYGTYLSTLCHEICHHLDVVCLGLPNTFHTRGFYERAGLLYHHARGTPARALVWDRLANGTFRINWSQTMRAGAGAAAGRNRLS
jgi:hypothetical protein